MFISAEYKKWSSQLRRNENNENLEKIAIKSECHANLFANGRVRAIYVNISVMCAALLSLASCKPSARQTTADAEQPTDSIEAVTSADTLRLVITDKHLSQTDSLTRRTLRLPLDSITVEIVNNTESTCITGEAYTIEQRVNDVWTILPIKPRKDGAVYAFNDIGYELAPHSTRLFTIHVEPDKYDFERGQEYRIVKEFFKKGKKVPQSVYCYFSFE